MKLEVTRNQMLYVQAQQAEVLFGGAAGGGKSYALLVDAFLYAMRYAGSRQLVLRRTFPELEKSLIRTALAMYPAQVYRYNASKHVGRFSNGSLIDFGYCDAQGDMYRYQSAEYDTLRFDELTHFTHEMYLYLMSRLRGANDFPKQVKSCTNPGGVGHVWVKERFVDPAPAGEVFAEKNDKEGKNKSTKGAGVWHEASGKKDKEGRVLEGTRVFLPSRVQDNQFLLKADPGYVRRLEQLPEKERRALLYGDWDLFEGQYFSEFEREKHVVKPFVLHPESRVYRAMDYGLDMLACYWIALEPTGRAVVFRELYLPDLIISDAAKAILEMDGEEKVFLSLAPPDLWNRRQESGRSVADIFGEQGIVLTKSGGGRVDGWMAVKEWLKCEPVERDGEQESVLCETGGGGVGNTQGGGLDAKSKRAPRMVVFENCRNLIRTLPALQHAAKNPNDVAGAPHELTHAPDALRCFCGYWTQPPDKAPQKKRKWSSDMWEDYYRAGSEERVMLERIWGQGC